MQIKAVFGDFCGNSFALIDIRSESWSKSDKARVAIHLTATFPIDSVLYFSESSIAFGRLDIFEGNGSESDMCGNGVLFTAHIFNIVHDKLETKAGILEVGRDNGQTHFCIDRTFSEGPVEAAGHGMIFINCGEPHLILPTVDARSIALGAIGAEYQQYYPKGVNVNALEKLSEYSYFIRTYERGVLGLTKSCGTGSLSSWIYVTDNGSKFADRPIQFISAGGEHWVQNSNEALKISALDSAFSYYGRLEDMMAGTDVNFLGNRNNSLEQHQSFRKA